MAHAKRALLLAPVGLALLLAGCGAGPDESASPDCVRSFISIHYSAAPEAPVLRQAFEDAEHSWSDRTDRIANIGAPNGVTIVASSKPGVSGPDLVLSFEEAAASMEDLRLAAQRASSIVNASSEGGARIERWIEAERPILC